MFPSPRHPLRRATPHTWAPLTDTEWSRLQPLVSPGNPAKGGRPTDRRRTWDAIFWVACSNKPWRELPEHLGRPDSAHRALRRAARSGIFPTLLLLISGDPDTSVWEALRYRLCRACRRVAKILPLAVTLMANRLGLRDALPCAPHHLPRPGLSECVKKLATRLHSDAVFPAIAAEIRLLHRLMMGRYRDWRLTE